MHRAFNFICEGKIPINHTEIYYSNKNSLSVQLNSLMLLKILSQQFCSYQGRDKMATCNFEQELNRFAIVTSVHGKNVVWLLC